LKPKKKVTPETALKNQAKDFLALYRIWTFPVLQGLGAHPGIADRLGIYLARPLAIEFKRVGGVLNDNQIAFKKQWEDAGGLFIICRSIEDLAAGLGIKTLFN
jgi:hypothetical protein